MIQHVVSIRADSEVYFFGQRNIFQDAEIGIEIVRSAEGIPGNVAEIRFGSETRELSVNETLGWCPTSWIVAAGSRSAQKIRHHRKAGSVLHSSDVVAGHTPIRYSVRISAAPEDRTGEDPPAYYFVHHSAGLKRKLPDVVGADVVTHVVVRVAVVEAAQAGRVNLV